MQFAHPLWILAGFMCCLATLILLRLLQKRRQATLEKFAGAQLLGRLTRHVSSRRRQFKHALLLLGIFLLFVTLAQPQYGSNWVEVKRKGIDILFALDTSKSMLAEDTRPNRLERAKLGIMDFVEQLQGDRVGLMPFAGSGYLMCPLTLDYDAFTSSLNSINTEIIPVGGTNISAVIKEAEQVLNNDANHKILILLTDGENLQGDALLAARKAKENGMTIYTIGVGTPGGELIPLSGQGPSGFVKDDDGKYVTSKLDEKNLRAIAETTDGIYAPLGNNGEGLEQIYQQKLDLIPKEELMERRQKVPIERFGWPLSAAIVLLVLEYMMPDRKSQHKLTLPRITTVGRRLRKTVAPMLILAYLFASTPEPAAASEAEEAYNDGDYLKASELYNKAIKEHPDDPQLHYNLGTTAYKNNLHDEAIAAFSQALKSDDLSLQEKAYYNRGNALFQKGAESQQANPQTTIEQWQQALESYDSALKLNPDDIQAQENHQYVAQKLEELQKQQQQDQKDQKDQKDDQNKNDQDSQQQNDQQNQGQDPSQQQDQENDQQESSDKQQDDKNNGQDQQQSEAGDKNDASQESAADKAPGDQEKGQPQPVNQQEQSSAQADQDAEKSRDLERRELGKMTTKEAENLLNALKNEEGELNFVPREQDSPVEKDW